MATFTRIPEGDTPSICVDVERRLSKIGRHPSLFLMCLGIMLMLCLTDPMIYGGFME